MEQHGCINIAELATLKNEVKNMKEQMSDLKDIKNSLTVLTTLQQENEKRDIERDVDRKKQSDALIILSETPRLIAKLDKKLDLQNDKLQAHDEKFIDIDNRLSFQTANKVNQTEITKSKLILYGTIITVIATMAGSIIVALIK
jgi:hypothetical protein